MDEDMQDHLLKHFSSEVLVSWIKVLLEQMGRHKYIHEIFRKV